MGKPLHILIVDDRPDGILFLSEFLLSKQHHVESTQSASEALDAILRKQRTVNAYDLLICDVVMPGMDGLSLVREIRRRNILLPVALYTAYGMMHPNLAQEAQQLNCLMVLNKPIELRRIENLINEVHAKRYGTARQTTQQKDEPFFGTSRVSKQATDIIKKSVPLPDDIAPQTSALEPRKMPVAMPPASPGTARRVRSPAPFPPQPPPSPLSGEPNTTRRLPSFRTPPPGDQQRRDGTEFRVNAKFRSPLPFLQPGQVPPPLPPPIVPTLSPLPLPPPIAPPMHPPTQPPTQVRHKTGTTTNPATAPATTPATSPHTTSHIRRRVEPPPTGQVQRGTQPHQIPPTTRIRRTVTGSYQADQQETSFVAPTPESASRAVACAHCDGVFMVAVRAASYVAVCAHCGQMNRIDP
jgi:CheY-like chemotaxis protein